MPITPIVYPFPHPQPNSSIEVRPLSTNRKVMLTKSSSPIRETSVCAGSTSTGEPLDGVITSPVHIPGSTSKPADSLSKSPTKRELINTAFKHSIKVANSPPMHRRSSSYSSSPGKSSSLQIRIDDQHLTHKNVQIFDSSVQQKMLRKKSGEVVRPVLKPHAASKSAPSTPTCSKNVRFDTQLEHVRLYLPAETPADVVEDAVVDDLLTVLLPNLPPPTTSGPQGKTVYVDVGSLGLDGKVFVGKVQVQNLAYQKRVNVHYTFDFWKTICEIQADYMNSTAAKSLDGPTHDIFSFSIPLDEKVGGHAASGDKQNTMCFAVKYSVDGRDYWDNNSGCNYRAEFKRVASPSLAQPKAAAVKSASKRTTGNVGKKSTKEFGVSPPSFSSSPDMTSVPVSKSASKKSFGQYHHNLSFTSEKKNTLLQPQIIGQSPSHSQRVKDPSYFNTIPGTMDDGHPISIYSEDSLSSSATISPVHWKERVVAPISVPLPMAKRPLPEKASPKETTTGHYTFGTLPINCPRPNADSPTYYDLVQKYCFYRTSSSPCSGNSYSNSPPTMIIG